MKNIYSIGEVAKLKGTTLKTLRYYDEIGLLKPSYTNPENGYRYYSFQQLFTLEFILMLKNSGVSLDKIKNAFQKDDWVAVIDLCQNEIADAQKQMLKAEESIFKFQNLSQRIQADQINSVNTSPYYRYFPVRKVLIADCTFPPMHDVAYGIFSKLYQKVRDYKLTSFYGTGNIVSLDMCKKEISYKQAYVEAYPNAFSEPVKLVELPKGTCFCITYSEKNKEKQISKMIDLLHIFEKTPKLILESDTFYTTREYKNQVMELQVLL